MATNQDVMFTSNLLSLPRPLLIGEAQRLKVEWANEGPSQTVIPSVGSPSWFPLCVEVRICKPSNDYIVIDVTI
jgi:hypothetical protein